VRLSRLMPHPGSLASRAVLNSNTASAEVRKRSYPGPRETYCAAEENWPTLLSKLMGTLGFTRETEGGAGLRSLRLRAGELQYAIVLQATKEAIAGNIVALAHRIMHLTGSNYCFNFSQNVNGLTNRTTCPGCGETVTLPHVFAEAYPWLRTSFVLKFFSSSHE
jgi:hypothetical protein